MLVEASASLSTKRVVGLADELGDEDPDTGEDGLGNAVARPIDKRHAAPVRLLRDVRRIGWAECRRDERALELFGLELAAQVEGLRRPRGNDREGLDPLHGRAAQAEELEDRGARLRHGERRTDRNGEGRDDEHERAAAPARRRLGHSREHAHRDVRRRREGELLAEQHEGALELGHGLTSSRSRRRSSAREVRDLTVPRRQPSVEAVSSSESPRK